MPVPCDRVLFFRLDLVMPVLLAGITRVRWRLCEQPQDGGATLWGGIGYRLLTLSIHCMTSLLLCVLAAMSLSYLCEVSKYGSET